jgi:Uma2 family endonuclease
MTQARLRFANLEDYLNYDDGTDRRYELVNGELIELPAESDLNVQIAGFLFVMLSQVIPYYLLRRGTEIVVSSHIVTSRCPDLIVLTEPLLASLEGATRSVITPDMPAPALVVEIVSPGETNHERDYVAKRLEYAERGIPEYWLIDPEASLVTVLRLDGKTYQSAEFRGRNRLISPAFGVLQLTAEQLLKAGR